MKETKRTWNFYSAWNWQQEIDDLNAQSDAGWQLMHGGLFGSRFKYQPHVRYRYQLDFPGKIDEMPRYLEIFREQGWEFVNKTVNGWYYFRKPYDPSADALEYEINTDRTSLDAMAGRWVKLGTIFSVIMGIMLLLLAVMLVLHPTLAMAFLLLALLPMFIMMVRGIVLIRREDKKRTIRHDGKWIGACVLAFAVFYAGFVLLAANRVNTYWQRNGEDMDAVAAELSEETVWATVDIRYPDFYYLSLDVKADAPVTVTLTDEKLEPVHVFTGEVKKEEDVRLWLKKGEYQVHLSDFAGGAQQVGFELD